MNYPCEIIRDLLPLYHDGVCSKESRAAVESHLAECKECAELYEKMRESDSADISEKRDIEARKAASLAAVKKKINRKSVVFAAVSVITVLTLLFFGAMAALASHIQYAPENKISVTIENGDIIGQLQGSRISGSHIKRIPSDNGDLIFFSVKNSAWDTLTASDDEFSKVILAYADKGADDVSGVYYYPGDLTKFDDTSNEDIRRLVSNSRLVWSNKSDAR